MERKTKREIRDYENYVIEELQSRIKLQEKQLAFYEKQLWWEQRDLHEAETKILRLQNSLEIGIQLENLGKKPNEIYNYFRENGQETS